MEKSPARVTRDLSTPWLRPSGRDDGLGVVHRSLGHSTADSLSLPCHATAGLLSLPPSFRLQVRYRSLVFSTVGSAGTGMEKSPARVTRDLSAPWLRHCGREDGGVVATAVEMTVRGGYYNVWCDGGVVSANPSFRL